MADLTLIPKIWGSIVESNLFNFIVFIFLFSLIFKKIKIGKIISSLQTKIITILDEAKQLKAEADESLKHAENSVVNLESELKSILEDAQKGAEFLSEKIMTEAERQLQNIEANAKKVIKAEENLLISKLTKNTSLASVEFAKNNIREVLNQTPSLHEKYIDESIDELDRLNF